MSVCANRISFFFAFFCSRLLLRWTLFMLLSVFLFRFSFFVRFHFALLQTACFISLFSIFVVVAVRCVLICRFCWRRYRRLHPQSTYFQCVCIFTLTTRFRQQLFFVCAYITMRMSVCYCIYLCMTLTVCIAKFTETCAIFFFDLSLFHVFFCSLFYISISLLMYQVRHFYCHFFLFSSIIERYASRDYCDEIKWTTESLTQLWGIKKKNNLYVKNWSTF